jgi:hypothetical protein
MSITLTPEAMKYAQATATESGFRDVDAYVNDLVMLDAILKSDEWDRLIPERMSVRSRKELEEKLTEAMVSLERGEGVAATPEFYSQIIENAQRAAHGT